MTTKSAEHNLQIQINKETTISTLKKYAPRTVSHVLVPKGAGWTAEEVRTKLNEGMNIWENLEAKQKERNRAERSDNWDREYGNVFFR